MPAPIEFTVNGERRTTSASASTPLLNVLRNDLGLTAARYGCGLEQCGACKTIIDGEAVPTCDLSVSEVAGKEIRTLEGLGDIGELHPVQQAFVDEQAAQCGFCTSGLVLAIVALLESNPTPSDAEIRDALRVHVCRCGIHHRILRAVHRAARLMT